MLLALSPRLFARRFFALSAALVATALAASAQTPGATEGFDPDVNGTVLAVVAQTDGKLVLGGQFTSVRGFPRNNLARLNADGSVDESFNPNPDAPVRVLLLQPDNRVLVGGDFKEFHPNGATTAISRGRLARLEANGAVDAFNPNVDGLLQPQVLALALQPNGQVVAGGTFTTVQPNGTGAVVTRNYVARFNADGSLDAAYNPNPNAMVLSLAYHVDNKIVLGGAFTSLQPAGDTAPTARNRIARLNPNGKVDSEFNPNANNGVTALAVQRDGKVLLGGFFTTVQPVGDTAPANRIHIARLNADGTLDSEFYPRVEGNVAAISLQPDGGILVGGNFTSAWGRGSVEGGRAYLARFSPDGTLDAGFFPAVNAQVDAFAPLPDGRVVIGGHFTRIVPEGATSVLVRNHLARLDASGALDASFELEAGGRILTSVTQTDGKVVVAGTFSNIGGATHNYVARLNPDGSVDATYNPDFNGRVYTLAYDASSNKVLAGGAFTTVNGETRNHIVRLNPSGTIDSEFNPNIDGQVGSILLQGDGRILVAGAFANVQPLGAATATSRNNILRLNANGTLDTGFDPATNSTVSAIALQPDGKVLLGGLFSTITPGYATNTSATVTTRNFLARVNSDGTLDTTFDPRPNAQVSTIVVQSDNKIVLGGVFNSLLPNGATTGTTRNHIARVNADGTLDTAYDPNANGNVLTAALQPDGKLLIGGSFTTLQPNGATDWTLRKYAARLNTDGTVDSTFNLDLSEMPGNRVDSIRVQSDRVYVGGAFTSLQPAGTAARLARRNFVRLALAATGTPVATVDTAFDAGAASSTGAIVNGLAVQADGKVIAVGDFADLGGAKSANIARFLPEGPADPSFSATLGTDGPINAVVVRPNAAPVSSPVAGFAWLNNNGTLRTAFAPTVRLSGDVSATAVQSDGSLLLGGTFTNLDNTSGGNLVRLRANGTLDTSFNPAPNGTVGAIVIQPDGKIIIAGTFTSVSGVTRNRLARLNSDGSLDSGWDPNASARVSALALQSDGLLVIGGAFTTLTPNGTTTSVGRTYLARLNADGTVDSNYNPAPNAPVNALALQSDNKVIAGGTFTSAQPNGGATAFNRNFLARFNADGTLDQNFDPNPNSAVNTLVTLPNGQILVGGAFTTFQPNATGTVIARNNLARINSDGAVDAAFSPNVNAGVNTIAVDATGGILIGGTFTTVQGTGSSVAITRNRLARLSADGTLDTNFNPDVNNIVAAIAARPDGTVLVAGKFSELQLNGSIFIGGSFANVGGVPARNLAAINNDGSVSTSFQPRPDNVVNAMLVQPDGKVVVGGAFSTIAGAARARVARFNADGTLDTAFAPTVGETVLALARQPDGKILLGGSFTSGALKVIRVNADGSTDATFNSAGVLVSPTFPAATALAVQPDGRILVAAGNGLVRLNATGQSDGTVFSLPAGTTVRGLALQADGRIVVAADAPGSADNRLIRFNAEGSRDLSFAPAPNGGVTAVALQSDGRTIVGGSFTRIAGQTHVGIARLGATSAATQNLGVSANRATVTFTRSGPAPELSGVLFELSTDRATWTRLGEGVRIANSANWQLAGLNLPATGLFYVRARGIAPSSGRSSSVVELIREFSYSNPLGLGPTVIAQTPAQAAAPGTVFDPVTGIAPRALVTTVAGEGTVEIIATQQAQRSGAARLMNLSTRGRVTADNPLLLGFAISGTESRSVLVRAIGPALQGFGVADALPAARLQVYDAKGAVIASNEGWAGAANLAQAATATGAFPLNAGSADSAALLNLAPGNYTIQVVDARGTGGVALAEIYDAGTGAGSRLVNVSSRGAAGTGSAALISGFVIAGADSSERVLLRGVGPGLAVFGAGTVVNDPSLALFDAEGRTLGTNDNWVSSVSDVSAASAASGAFALTPGSKDAAVLATLPSGAYTIQVSAPNAGTALLEIYEVR